MNRLFEITLIVSLLQTTPPQQLPAATGATIAGVVIIAGSNEPVAGAGVELSRVIPASRVAGPPTPFTPASTAITVETNDDGRFTLNNIPPGDYRLAAAHAGFVRSEYGQRGYDGAGQTITVTAGQSISDVRVILTKTSSLTGRITDRNGDPFPNVQVQALKYVYENGRRVLSTAKAMVTDDLGEYRLFWMQPGDYVVMARPLRGAVSDTLMMPMGNGGFGFRNIPSSTGAPILVPEDAASIPFFFPGSTDVQSAAELHLNPGEDVGSINITIRGVNTHHVRGTIANLPSNLPVPVDEGGTAFLNLRVNLVPRVASAFDYDSTPIGPGTSADRKAGTFDIPGVPPGSYLLNVGLSGTGNESQNMHAQIALEVGGEDINVLSITLEPDFDVPVRIVVDGSAESIPAQQLSSIRVRLANSREAQRLPTGLYVFRQIRPFAGKVIVDQLPDDAYVKSVRLNDTDVLAEGLHIDRSPETPIEIVIGGRAGVVSGTVKDASNTIPNATVALVPNEPNRNRSDLYRNATTDAAGKFRITGITPGDYSILAWDYVPKGAWQNPQFIKANEDHGKPVHIDEGSVVDTVIVRDP